MAWLPGSEGHGVADVLFGDYKPTGKLPFTWPRSIAQLPTGGSGDEPLFPYGYGLTYAAAGATPQLIAAIRYPGKTPPGECW